MENQEEQIKRLGDALSTLFDFVPFTEVELRDWYDQAQVIIDAKIRGANIGVPHFLWHYLSDADIRFKDGDYAEMQNGRMKVLLQHLRNGSMPSDDEV